MSDKFHETPSDFDEITNRPFQNKNEKRKVGSEVYCETRGASKEHSSRLVKKQARYQTQKSSNVLLQYSSSKQHHPYLTTLSKATVDASAYREDTADWDSCINSFQYLRFTTKLWEYGILDEKFMSPVGDLLTIHYTTMRSNHRAKYMKYLCMSRHLECSSAK